MTVKIKKFPQDFIEALLSAGSFIIFSDPNDGSKPKKVAMSDVVAFLDEYYQKPLSLDTTLGCYLTQD
jgi:hypothetical protein